MPLPLKQRLSRKIHALLASPKFFVVSLFVFTGQALWIALSGVFPMPYDEDTHFSTIQLYSHRFLPFWSHQPVGANKLGAIFRDPSYMYHYLISFPFRVFAYFFDSQMAQVIFLRLFSIVFFVIGIYIFRKLMLQLNISKAITHTVLALFILTPLTPFIAAQINYDTLLFPLTAATFLLAIKIIQTKRQGSLDVKNAILVILVGLFSSLVMYSYLPLFFTVLVLLAYGTFGQVRRSSLKETITSLKLSFKSLTSSFKILTIILLIVLSGLFVERYGVNTVRYHNPVPDCDKVLNIDACMEYSPWRRNYLSHLSKLAGNIEKVPTNPLYYSTYNWLGGMLYQLFYTFNGPKDEYRIGKPLVLPMMLGVIVAASGTVFVIAYRKRFRRIVGFPFLALASLFYFFILWEREYTGFLYVGYPVAIQARYIIAFVPLLYLLVALAYQQHLKKKRSQQALFATLAIAILLIEGGGASTFILRSNSKWYWSSQVVNSANQTVQKIMRTFVIGA